MSEPSDRVEPDLAVPDVTAATVAAAHAWRRTAYALAAIVAVLLVAGASVGISYYMHQRHQAAELAARREQVNKELGDLINEAAARREELHRALRDPAEAANLLSEIDRWPQLLHAAKVTLARAEALAHAAPELVTEESATKLVQVQNALAVDETDWDVARRLDEVRLQAASPLGGKPDVGRARREYPIIFRHVGVPLDGSDVAELGKQLGRSPIHMVLVPALDHWAEISNDDAVRTQVLTVARQADPDPWRDHLRDPKVRTDLNALSALADDPAAQGQPPHVVIALAARLDATGGNGLEVLRKAVARCPRDFWLLYQLGNIGPSPEERLRYLRAALAVRPNCMAAHVAVGQALEVRGDVDGAVAEYQKSVKMAPKDARAQYQLGIALRGQQDIGGAIAHLREAVAAEPEFVQAHYHLGNALADNEDAEAAIEAFRRAIDLDAACAPAYHGLGNALYRKKHYADALDHFRLAVQHAPEDADARSDLGMALLRRKDAAGAVEHYRKAAALKPQSATIATQFGAALLAAHDIESAIAQHQRAIVLDGKLIVARLNLGSALEARKDFVGAIEQYRKILELDGKRFDAYSLVAHALIERGDFAEARKTFAHILKVAPAKDPAARAAPQQIKQCDQLLALDKTLAEFLQGADAPEDAVEQLTLADFCRKYKQYHVTAARLYASALAGEPKLADDLVKGHRHHAACSAALAASGKGLDPRQPGSEERNQLREHALNWLGADLTWYKERFQAGDAKGVLLAFERIPAWQTDSSLAGVREPKMLPALSAHEQAAWTKLWTDAQGALKSIRTGVATTEHTGKLTDAEPERIHELKVQAGKQYIVDMRSADVDSLLKLIDPAGKVLAENDNVAPDNPDAQLILAPTADSTLRLVASSHRGQGRGEYALTIRSLSAPSK
jgi:tetratricopeptide (TPR) repeat protein